MLTIVAVNANSNDKRLYIIMQNEAFRDCRATSRAHGPGFWGGPMVPSPRRTTPTSRRSHGRSSKGLVCTHTDIAGLSHGSHSSNATPQALVGGGGSCRSGHPGTPPSMDYSVPLLGQPALDLIIIGAYLLTRSLIHSIAVMILIPRN